MSQQTLVIATRNSGKLFELRQLLRDLPFILCDLNSFPLIESVRETGATFAENVCLKARVYAEQTGSLALADDSGLEVDSLGGAPGVYSARYAGAGASDAQRIEKLLAELSKGVPGDRAARFVSAVAIANSGGRILSVSSAFVKVASQRCREGQTVSATIRCLFRTATVRRLESCQMK